MPIQTFNGFPRPIPDSGTVSVKSIQQGTGTIAGTLTTNVTISAVDITKSIVIIYDRGVDAGATPAQYKVTAQLTTPTNILLTRTSTTNPGSFSWLVIEFFNVKSLQTGTRTLTAPGTTTISAVNTAKAFVIFSMNVATTFVPIDATLTNSTTISFGYPTSTSASVTAAWQVIEFF